MEVEWDCLTHALITTALIVGLALMVTTLCGQVAEHMDDSYEASCFSARKTRLRMKACLGEKRSAGECLQEVRAMCLVDLADK